MPRACPSGCGARPPDPDIFLGYTAAAMLFSRRLLLFIVAALSSAMMGCASTEPPLQAENPKRVDFSGHWELDYGQSDNIQSQLNALVRELRRQAERQAQGNVERRGAISVGGAGTNSAPTVVGLAQMADMITQSQLLEILQSSNDIRVKREGNFALTCEFYSGDSQVIENPLGTEICGWSGHQLVFRIYLPEGLSVQHVMSMGPSGERMGIATTVVSDRVSQPFTLNRVYNRYDPGQAGYSCEQTLTRGRVCTTEQP